MPQPLPYPLVGRRTAASGPAGSPRPPEATAAGREGDAMYGTVMIARPSVSIDELRRREQKWEAERSPGIGYVDQWVMAADDGRLVMAVRFESKERYLALADDPAQDEWWSTEMAPLLDGDPEWIDGEWLSG